MSDKPGQDGSAARFADGLADDLRVCFGSNLRIAREKAGLTQSDVQVRTGIKQYYISQIENGQQNPTLGTMTVLAMAVGKNLSSMLRPRPSVPSRRQETDKAV